MVFELLSSARTTKIKGEGGFEIQNAVLMTNSIWNHGIHGDGDWSVAHKDGVVISLEEWHQQNETSNSTTAPASEYPEWLLEADFSANFVSGPNNSSSRVKESEAGPAVQQMPYFKTGEVVAIFIGMVAAGYTVKGTWATGYDGEIVRVVDSVFKDIRWLWPFIVGTYEWYAWMRPDFLDDIQHAPDGVTPEIQAALRNTWEYYQGNALKVGFLAFNVYTDEVLQKHKNAALQAAGKTEIEPVPQSIWQILWMQKYYEAGDDDDILVGASDLSHGGPKDSSGNTTWLPLSKGYDSVSLKEAFNKGRRKTMIQYDWYSPGKQAYIADHGYKEDRIRYAFWPPHETATKVDSEARLINRTIIMDNDEQVTIQSYNSATGKYTVKNIATSSTSLVSSSRLVSNTALVYTSGSELKSISRLFPNWEWVLEEGVYVGQYRFSPTDELPLFPAPLPASSTIDLLLQGQVGGRVMGYLVPAYSIFGSLAEVSLVSGSLVAQGITSDVLHAIQDDAGKKFPDQSANINRQIPPATSFANLSWASGTLTSTNGQVYDFVSGQHYVSILRIKELIS